jgi:hypothetical protein
VSISTAPKLSCDGVARFVFRRQVVDVRVCHGVYGVHEVIDAVRVDRDTETQLSFNLVALGNGDIAHIVAEPSYLHAAEGGVADGGLGPHPDAFPHRRVRHVSRDSLAPHPNPRLCVAELTVAVRGLVEVHEIHVDAGPGQLDIGLCVQV